MMLHKISKIGFWIFFFTLPIFLNANLNKKAKIAFFLRHIGYRGVEKSTFDYADFNEKILGNTSYIFYVDVLKDEGKTNNDIVHGADNKFIKRFKDRFFECENFEEVEALIQKLGIDILYNQKSGMVDTHISKFCKNVIHAVFLPFEVHGDAFATISSYLCDLFPDSGLSYVPYIVRTENVQEDLRKSLGIPKEAVVFGRHGGYKTFDVPYIRNLIPKFAEKNPDWFFLFLNTEPLRQKKSLCKNIFFLEPTEDSLFVEKFINTCDAMIHARLDGETFGLACAEFSVKNKPIISFPGKDLSHFQILGKKGLFFTNSGQFRRHLEWVAKNKEEIKQMDWDAYSKEFSPEVVMKKFDEIFIQPCLKG